MERMNRNRIMKWTKVWKPPFKTDGYGYVWDRDNVMTFSADDLTEENDKEIQDLCKDIVAVLNGGKPEKTWSGLSIKDGCDLYRGEELLGSFRGWGHLTGGLKLNCYEAAQVQDQLIKEVLIAIAGSYVNLVQDGK